MELELVDGIPVSHVVLGTGKKTKQKKNHRKAGRVYMTRSRVDHISNSMDTHSSCTLIHCIVMWLITRMMPREPATASRGWLVLVSYVHAHV